MKTHQIILYDEPTVPEIDIEQLEKFLLDTFQIKIKRRGNFFSFVDNRVIEKIAGTRIFDNPVYREFTLPTHDMEQSDNLYDHINY